MGKHPRIFNLLLILILISMTGLAAFLISDILSFGFNSDHKCVLAGIEFRDPIMSTMSAANWNEKRTNLAVKDNPKAQKDEPNRISSANSSQNDSNLSLMAANASGMESNSTTKIESVSQKTGELNLSNSSRTESSSLSSQASSYINVGKTTSSGTGSNKPVDKKETITTTAIKHHSSSGTSISGSKSPTQNDLDQSQKGANGTTTNGTTANNTSTYQLQEKLQEKGISLNMLSINEARVNQPQMNQSSDTESHVNPSHLYPSCVDLSKCSVAQNDPSKTNSLINANTNLPQSTEDRTIAGPLVAETAKDKSGNENGLSEAENNQFAPDTSQSNPAKAVPFGANGHADQAALAKSGAASYSDPAKETATRMPVVKIEFKTDSTANSKSEASLSEDRMKGEDHANSGTASSTGALSDPGTQGRSTVKYSRNAAPVSKDSTSTSKSQAQVKRSESVQKADTVTYIKTKTQQLQESRSQQIAKRNQVAEDAKKRTIRSREGTA